jgi:hypothetical protein
MPDASHDMLAELNLSLQWRRAVLDGGVSGTCVFPDRGRVHWGVTLDDAGGYRFFEEAVDGTKRPAPIKQRLLADGRRMILHPYRPFRPGAAVLAPGPQKDLETDFRKCSFGCQDPHAPLSLLVRTPLARLSSTHYVWQAYVNASPFVPEGHLIWVPVLQHGGSTVLPHLPQTMSRDVLHDFIHLVRAIRNAVTFFNASHAGASAFHLHLQTVALRERLAIQLASRRTVGPLAVLDHPATVLVADPASPPALWNLIETLHANAIPFNLIGVGDSIYVVPRNPEYEVVGEFPGAVMASMEFAGLVITGNRDLFENLTAERLAGAMAKTTLSLPTVLEMIDRQVK